MKSGDCLLLSKILCAVDYSGIVKNDEDISQIIYNSKLAEPSCLFVCISGFKADGHKYAMNAYENGVRSFIVEKEVSLPDDAQVFMVYNSRAALGALSAEFFGHPDRELKLIGITGTKGKTTSAHLVQKMLNASGIPCGIIGTVGAEFNGKKYPTNNTTPESFELYKLFRNMLDDGCKAVALEVSSIGIKQGRVDNLKFAVGVFTNLSPDHIGKNEHDTYDEYADFKSKLFERCDIAVINYDDEAYSIMIRNCNCQIIKYGIVGDFDIEARNIVSDDGNGALSFECNVFERHYQIKTSLKGYFNIYNILSSVGVAYALGCDINKAVDSLRDVQVRGRVESLKTDSDFEVIIDYAHNGLSLKSIIETLKKDLKGRLICVFGSVGGRTQERRKEMGLVAGSMCDLCVVTSDNPDFEDPMNVVEDIVSYIKQVGGKYYAEPDRKKAIEYSLSIAESGDIILLAGKGHEEYQLIKGEKIPFSEKEIVENYVRRNRNNA